MFKTALPALFLLSAFSVFGSTVGTVPCATGTLAAYESGFAPPSSGCSIGILDYSTFSYQDLQGPAISASDVLVTPGTGSNGFSFSQVGGAPFSANGDVVQFAIYYTIVIDPAPVIPGADTHLDPPVGDVSVTEYFCNDSLLRLAQTTYSCQAPASSIYSLTVTTAAPNAAITFKTPATQYETVGIVFTLDGTKGLASFDGLDTNTTVTGAAPEPASVMLVGLFMVAGGYKLKKRKN